MKWHHRIDLPDGTTPGDWDQTYIEAAIDALPLTPTTRVLDVGALDGGWTYRCELRAGHVHAIDRSDYPTMRHVLKTLPDDRVKYEVTSVEQFVTTCPPESFDVVLFMGMIYHIHSPIDVLCGLSRLLVPQGLLVVESEVSHTLQSWFGKTYRNGDTTIGYIPDCRTLREWLAYAGFDVLTLHNAPRGRTLLTCRKNRAPPSDTYGSSQKAPCDVRQT